MSSGIFSVAITGMNAAQIGMLTTGHNITNADTPGYNRQRIGQTTNIALATGAGFIGQGTHVQTVSRVYNSFLQSQINTSQTTASELGTYATQLKQIDNLLADVNAGLSPALQNFFKGVQTFAGNPSSIPSRDAFVSSAQTLATRFQTLGGRLDEMYQGVNEQISSTVSLINSYANQIATINERIMVAQSASNQPPNDLLDERDRLISDLNKEVKTTTVEQSDGSLSVFIGTGQQLVVGTRASQLDARPSVADGERVVVGLQNGPAYQELPESLISGGNLSGYLRFRSETLDKAANALGSVAASVALVYNAQQSLGQDLMGKTSADTGFASQIFQFGSVNVPKIIENTLNTGAGKIVATPATQPGQTAGYLPPSMSGGYFSTQLTSSDYEVRFLAGGNFAVKRLSDGVDVATGTGAGTVTFDGVSIDINAVGNNGDKFLIEPTREVARNLSVNPLVSADSRLLAAASPVRSGIGLNAGLPNSGTGTISTPSVAPGYTIPAAPVSITFNAGNLSGFPAGPVTVTSGGTTTTYNVPADPVPYTSGATIAFGGVSFEISGGPANGDTFTIQSNANGVADGSNALRMGKLESQNTMLGDASAVGGKASFQGVYAQLVSQVGNKTREIQVTAAAQVTLLEQAQAARDSQSGVNLDEEAANLLRYQYAYQAAAKMLEAGTKMFDTVLSIAA